MNSNDETKTNHDCATITKSLLDEDSSSNVEMNSNKEAEGALAHHKSANEQVTKPQREDTSSFPSSLQISQDDLNKHRPASNDIILQRVDKDANKEALTALASSPPLKRPRTAYFIFQGEIRPEVRKKHPSESIGTTARRIGKLWGALTPQEKEKYQLVASKERQQYNDAKKRLNLTTSNEGNQLKRQLDSGREFLLPLAKIRKICRLDPEVNHITKEALLLITKTAEQFVHTLGNETNSMAMLQNRKTILPVDILDVCSLKEQFHFLKNDIEDLTKEQNNQKKPQVNRQKKLDSHKTTGVKPLTSYFQLK